MMKLKSKKAMIPSHVGENPFVAGGLLMIGVIAGVSAMMKAGQEYDRIVPEAAEKIEITRATASALREKDDDD